MPDNAAGHASGPDNVQKIITGCPFDCGGSCPLLAYVEDGKLTRLAPVDGPIPSPAPSSGPAPAACRRWNGCITPKGCVTL